MDVTNMRRSLFCASIVAAVLSAIAAFVDWTAAFPLVPWGEAIRD